MLEEVITGVLTSVITSAGQHIAGAIFSLSGRKRREDDLDVARWFNTYRLTATTPDLPGELFGAVTEKDLSEALTADGCHAVLHELLALRLTSAHERDVSRLRVAFAVELHTSHLSQDVSPLADALFDYFDEEICRLVGRLEGALPDAAEKLRSGAIGTRIIAILNAIERHEAARSGKPDRQAIEDFLTRYRRHAALDYGFLEPPDFQRRRRVALEDLHVAPQIRLVSDRSDGDAIDNWKALLSIADHVVLLGDPGCGKTTTARALVHFYAVKQSHPVPFLVTLRDFATDVSSARSVLGHIEHILNTSYQCPVPPGLSSGLLLDGAALIVFDGLDELVDTSSRAQVARIIEHFCLEYPLAPVMITSRVVGYDEARLDDRQFARYRIEQFTDVGVAEYISKWFSNDDTLTPAQAEKSAEALLRESESARYIRANPLMLALMCILYRGEGHIPRQRAAIYAQCSDLLFNKWDTRRHIHVELRAHKLVEPALRHLAFWLLTRTKSAAEVTERALIAETTSFLRGRGFEAEEDAVAAAAPSARPGPHPCHCSSPPRSATIRRGYQHRGS
jgi:hypothetical protein